MREELLDEFIHRLAGLDEHHHAARGLEVGNHFRDGMRAENFRPLRLVCEKMIHLFRGAVVSDDGKTVVVHVENEILAHDGQTDECDVALRFHNMPKTIQKTAAAARKISGRGGPPKRGLPSVSGNLARRDFLLAGTMP